jgi:membrane-bound lytic murein transglycosylase D
MYLATTLNFARPAAICLLLAGCAMFPPPHHRSAPDAPIQRAEPPRAVPGPTLTLAGIETGDVLDKLRNGFALPALGGDEVRHQENWYRKHPGALEHLAEPGSWYLPYITGEVLRRGLPAEIALLPAIESHFNAKAKSPSGAAGLWQFTSTTADHLGLHKDRWLDHRMHLEDSTRTALDYLETLNDRFDGDWLLTLSAYNAGEGAVRQLMERNRRRGKSTDFRSLPFRAETRYFVPKLIALRNVVRNPERFGASVPRVEDRIRFVRVGADRQIRHREISALCRVPGRVITQINAEQIRGATPPNGPHRVRLPYRCGPRFEAARTAQRAAPSSSDSVAALYVVRPGDNLWTIARSHGVTLAALKDSNPGVDARLAPGQRIVVPDDREATLREPPGVVHHVTTGDTLWHLAMRYQVPANDIARWNRIAPNSTLRPGQRLNIGPR